MTAAPQMLLQFGQLQGLRMMVFVDGTNFLVELFRTFEISELRAESPRPNTASVSFGLLNHSLQHLSGCRAIRNFWFASFTGNDDNQSAYCQQLRLVYFTPLIFKKLQGHREKRVDISLTTSLLVNAQQKNFDIGVLVSGDADYLSVVEEVKRHGCPVYGCFFEANISPELRIAFDRFLPVQIPGDGREIYRERLLMTEPI